ncbi:MAG: NAD(P)/FAD-dependent oxidoreductase [Bacteroidales bacterium]|nr:NAD(P)/FAD-dependent oxidoreductase [Bacteroidales bacterium]
MEKKKKIIVVGGGFAGIQLIRSLEKSDFDILLIDKVNHHQFQPLFYQVATSQLEPSSISFPLRKVFKSKSHLQIRLAEVLSVDSDHNTLQTTIGSFNYDFLVLAMGCTTNFFGNMTTAHNAFTLKTTYDAIRIRNHILQTFERIISASEEQKEALLNLVIVGGGPTGVELAGAFAEIKNNILPRDYSGIDFSHFKITLIEGSADVLNNMSDNAKQAAKKYLQRMGVNLLTETIVKNYDGTLLELNNGKTIQSKTVIWAAGVIANTIEGLPSQAITKGNRVKVNRINLMDGSTNIFAVGDVAWMSTPNYPIGHPQVANVAIHQAKNLGRNLQRLQKKQATKDFTYRDLGSMATVGRNKAVVDLPFLKFKGYPAWLVWMFLHLMLILSVRNKLIIFINWAWNYISKDTSLRLILTDSKVAIKHAQMHGDLKNENPTTP